MRRVVCSLPGDVAMDDRGVHVFAWCAAMFLYWLTQWNG